MDDDDSLVTAGAIVTVTVTLQRQNSGDVFPILPSQAENDKQAIAKKKAKEEPKEKTIQDYEAMLIPVDVSCLLAGVEINHSY